MAKSITEKQGGFLNDIQMLDFLTVTMWVGYFYLYLETLNTIRNAATPADTAIVLLRNLMDDIKNRAGNVGTGKNTMDFIEATNSLPGVKSVRRSGAVSEIKKVTDAWIRAPRKTLKESVVGTGPVEHAINKLVKKKLGLPDDQAILRRLKRIPSVSTKTLKAAVQPIRPSKLKKVGKKLKAKLRGLFR